MGIGDWAQSPIPNPQSPWHDYLKNKLKNYSFFLNFPSKFSKLSKYSLFFMRFH